MGKAIRYIDSMLADVNEQAGRWTREQTNEWANAYWEIRQDKTISDEERNERLQQHEQAFHPLLNVHMNDRGNTIIRRHLSADRYFFDELGWKQFDTDQDASYYGIWVNPSTLQTLSYCEGDVTLVVCTDAAHYNAEISDMCSFYKPGFEFIACDMEGFSHVMLGTEPAGEVTVFSQDRQKFFI